MLTFLIQDTIMKSMKQKITTRKIALAGLIVTIEIILQVIANFVQIGPVSFNLSLIPIAVSAILLGPFFGSILGLVCGVMVLLSANTMSFFMPMSWYGTIIICLTKTTLAGFLSGFIYRLFVKHQFVGSIVSSLILPLVNTGVFLGFALLFYSKSLSQNLGQYPNVFAYLIYGMIGINFIAELASTIIISPLLCRAILKNKRTKGIEQQ